MLSKNNIKFNIEMFKDLAKQNDGICISKEYINCDSLLQFRCKENHLFERTGLSVKMVNGAIHVMGLLK